MCGGKEIVQQVTPSTKVSALRALISRSFGISVRKKRVVVYDNVDDDEVGEGVEIEEGDRLRDVSWFFSGRKATVVID